MGEFPPQGRKGLPSGRPNGADLGARYETSASPQDVPGDAAEDTAEAGEDAPEPTEVPENLMQAANHIARKRLPFRSGEDGPWDVPPDELGSASRSATAWTQARPRCA